MPGHTVRNFVDRNSKRGFVQILPLILLAAFAVTLFVTVNIMGNTQDIRSRAWSGITYNAERLAELMGKTPAGRKLDPNPLTSAPADDPTSSKSLFHTLSRTYWDAEVQNIALPQFGVEGVAMMKYDAALSKTLVFARIARLPLLEGLVVRLWIARNVSEYLPVGVAEFFAEGDGLTAYSVFSYPADLRQWEELLISYDTSLDVPAPESVVIRLKF